MSLVDQKRPIDQKRWFVMTLFDAEDYYNGLQNSRYRENAFVQWDDYRRKVTDFMIHNSRSGSSVSIYGAGRCCDIDIARLAAHFSKVTLIDINKASMEEAICRYGLQDNMGVKTKVMNFTGISDSSYVGLAGCISDYSAGRADSRSVLSALENIYGEAALLDLRFEKSDYSVAIALHSQLNDIADWICTDLTERLKMDPRALDFARFRIRRENSVLIKKFNDELIDATAKSIFVGYEKNIRGRNNPVTGASNTREDLLCREKRGIISLKEKEDMLWPYLPERDICFEMRLEKWDVKEWIPYLKS